MMHNLPRWPAIIKYEGENELAFVSDLHEWQADRDLSSYSYHDGDMLIDSEGRCYHLLYDRKSASAVFMATGTSLSLEEFSVLVQKHLGAANQCCISKIALSSYREGFVLIETTQ